MIWKSEITLKMLQELNRESMGEHLGIEFIEIGEDYLIATMPVDERTKQPFGILHGGASVVLAETLGSVASTYCIQHNVQMAVGIEINANHLRQVSQGIVKGVCSPIYIGGKMHVWEIKIYREDGELCCISKLTTSIIKRR